MNAFMRLVQGSCVAGCVGVMPKIVSVIAPESSPSCGFIYQPHWPLKESSKLVRYNL